MTLLTRATPRARTATRPRLELLEDRTALSITLPPAGEPGPVVLAGTDGADHFVVATAPVMAPGNWLAFSDDGGQTFEIINAAYVTEINVFGRGGDDTITLDSSAGLLGRGDPGPLPITYDGGAGSDLLELVGDPRTPVDTEFQPGVTGDGTVTMTDGTRSTVVTYTDVEVVIDRMPQPDPGPERPGEFGWM